MDRFCYLCFVFAMLSCLFIATLWSPAWKELTSCCVSVTFPFSAQGPVCFLIVLTPELCLISYVDFLNIT